MSSTAKERAEVLTRLARIGIASDDARALRRISLTLRRWFELECGDGRGCIERDEITNKPYYAPSLMSNGWTPKRRAIADRETGATVRLGEIMARYPHLTPYVQTDPRGASLYLLTAQQHVEGRTIDSYYSNGTAIY